MSVILIATACAPGSPDDPKRVNRADDLCESAEEDRFYAENAVFEDAGGTEWPRGEPSDVDLDPRELERATKELARTRSALSFLVVRDGKLVWERYFNGSKATYANNVHSASKSMLSLVTGRAVADGHLALDDRISDHLPAELVPRQARDLTVSNLLEMSAGLAWEENVTEEELDRDRSFVRQILEQATADEPGERFTYSTGLTQVLSAVIAEATGEDTCTYAHDELLDDIGVDVDHWPIDPDGYRTGGHSLFVTPRELAKIGTYVLDDDKPREMEAWVRDSFEQVWDEGCRAPSQHIGYGRLWWVSELADAAVWEAHGYGGQSLLIVPSLDLITVITNDTHTQHGDVLSPVEVLTNLVLPAAGAPIEPTDECAGFDIHRADLDGGAARRLTDHVSQDMWGSPSPDGSRIAFHTRRDLNWEIYAMDADGSRQRRLTDDPGLDSFARWSPDGKRILFSRDAGDRSGLYTMKPDGSDVRRLTRGADRTNAWSPDGRTIAFDRSDEDGEDGTLWLVDADGSNERRLEEGFLGTEPDWSPDGERIAFWTRNGSEHVYAIDASGGGRTRIAEGRDPHWLPDGSLLFAAPDGRGGTWRVARWEDGRSKTVVDTPGDDLLPIPSADGTWLTFASAPATAAGGSGVER